MTIKLDVTTENINTQYAPLAVLLAHYQQNQVLQPLREVTIPIKALCITNENTVTRSTSPRPSVSHCPLPRSDQTNMGAKGKSDRLSNRWHYG